MNIKAIETRYKGYRFRSRLEARWAVFFDALGLAWEYEPQGYALPSGNYLPDFYFPALRLWVEIKPTDPSVAERQLCRELARAFQDDHVVLFVGPPDESEYGFIRAESWHWEPIPADMLADMIADPENYGGQKQVDLDARDGGREWSLDPMTFRCAFFLGDRHAPDLDYRRAMYAARSARFEHGETPP